MKPNIGISDANLKRSTHLLSSMLANEMMLYVKTRKSHWSVSGESFIELHKLFEGQYNQLELLIDEIAERIGNLGGKTIGTMSEFLEFSSIKEHPGQYLSSNEILRELLSDHESIIIQLRKDVEESAAKDKDAGTADFFTRLMEQHETTSWILRRYLN
jgi:starvation-inducible DNA-binding protein